MAEANILDFRAPVNETPALALRGVWKDFVSSVAGIGKENYYSHKEMSSVLNHNLVLMHSLLMTTSSYREYVNTSFRRIMRNKYWGWQPVYEDSLGKAGLFSIYKNAPVPMHDHPHSLGALMVVEGEVEVERFNLEPGHEQGGSGMVKLKRYDCKRLQAFDITWFSANEGNIHRMQSLSDQCVMLKIQLCAKQAADRSWYFPLFNDNPNAEVIQARRIMSQYL